MMTREDKLERIGLYFYGDGYRCGMCEHYRSWREPRGEFWGQPAWETMSACGALECGDPNMCPILEEVLSGAHD
jgi:hypothetical protein